MIIDNKNHFIYNVFKDLTSLQLAQQHNIGTIQQQNIQLNKNSSRVNLAESPGELRSLKKVSQSGILLGEHTWKSCVNKFAIILGPD